MTQSITDRIRQGGLAALLLIAGSSAASAQIAVNCANPLPNGALPPAFNAWGPSAVCATASTAAAVSSTIATANTAFLTHTSPFVGSPTGRAPDSMGGGIWVRGVGGRLDTDARATVSTTGPVGAPFNGITLDANTRSTFGGFQVGADSGALNIWNSGWNMHFGLTAGYLSSEIRDRNGPGGMNFEIPFIGAYAAFVHSSGFFADVMVRGDFYTMNATNPLVGIVDRSFDGKGISVTSSAGYRFDLPNGFFIEPSAGLILSQVRVDNLVVDGPGPFGVPPGTVSFNTVKSLLGRAGARIGTTWTSGSLVISPFLAASVWHEFDDANQSTYVCNGCAFSMDVATSRIGTYGQYSAGASAAFGNTGWLGYVRFDYRNGQNVDGWTLGGGLRYQFDTGAVVAARY